MSLKVEGWEGGGGGGGVKQDVMNVCWWAGGPSMNGSLFLKCTHLLRVQA